MKLKKLLIILAAGLLSLPVLALSACDGAADAGGGANTYVMEAEYTDLTGVQGAGISSDPHGVELITGDGTQAQKDLGWSEGYFVSCTYNTAFKLTFNFEADKAGTATVILRLGSELGDLTLASDGFAVVLNGESISYSGMFVAGTSEFDKMKFYDKTVTTKAKLQAGANVLELKTLANKYANGVSVGGPMIDCVKIKTDCKLTYTQKTENPGLRGSIE